MTGLLEEKLRAFDGRATARQVYAWPWMNVPQLWEREGSRLRLQAWARAGCPAGPFSPSVVATSRQVFAMVSQVLKALPPPVAWHAAHRVLFVGLDDRTAGAAAYAPALPAAPAGLNEGAHVVLVGDLRADPAALVAHEIAHVWTSEVRPAAMPSDQLDAALASLADNPRLTEAEAEAMREAARGEELAHVLAHAWGFRGPHADPAGLRRRGAEAYVMEAVTR